MSRPGGASKSIRAEIVESVVSGLERRYPHVHLHVVVDLERTFTREALTAALGEAIDAMPVLGCRYRRRWWRDRWITWDGEVDALVHLAAVEDVERSCREWVRRPFPIDSEPPIRLALLEHRSGARLVVSLNHMVADGAGALAVAHVIASGLAGVDPDPPVGRDRRLRQVLSGVRLRDLPILIAELLRESVRPLAILRVPRTGAEFATATAGPRPHYRAVSVQGEVAARFAEHCRENGATINDGFVAALARVAASRSARGPVAVGYTIDLRRYLPEPRSLATNLAGVSLVVVRRDRIGGATETLFEVSRLIGEQKRRLPGLGNALLPAASFGWMPHGIMRVFGRWVVGRLASYFGRALVLTNIGAMDRALAPFGQDVQRASIVGPFVHGVDTPVVTVTGFRGDLTANVCASGNLHPEGIASYARELGGALDPARK